MEPEMIPMFDKLFSDSVKMFRLLFKFIAWKRQKRRRSVYERLAEEQRLADGFAPNGQTRSTVKRPAIIVRSSRGNNP